MGGCYLDTNLLYVHLRSPTAPHDDIVRGRVQRWRDRVFQAIGEDRGVISALVVDELAYRLILGWLRDDGDTDPLSTFRAQTATVMTTVRDRLDSTWRSLDALDLALVPTDRTVVQHAQALMAAPGLGPRDAFHAAHAAESGCATIASADRAFDDVEDLHRIAPE